MAFGSGVQPTFAQTKPPPPTPIPFAHPAIIALSLGSDPRQNAGLAGTLAKDVIERMPKSLESQYEPYPWIVPEADWDLSQYELQCSLDPNTKGAFILLSPAAGTAVENYIALLRSNLFVRFSVMLVQCNNRDAVPSPEPTAPVNQVVWVSQPETGINGRTSMEFFPLAVFASIYLAFAPQRIFQIVSLVAHPTPNPLPATGALVSTTTSNSTTLNAQGTSQQGGILTAFSNQNTTGTTIGQAAATEVQTARAAEDAINYALKELDDYCHPGKDASPPSPKPWFCPYIGPKH